MTEFWCVPACISCKQADTCAKTFEIPADEIVRFRDLFRPSRMDRCWLPCGCDGIPWPIIETLGLNIVEILCNRHGWVKGTKNWKVKAQREAHKRVERYYRGLPFEPQF